MNGMTEDEKGMEAALERARDAAHASGGEEGGDAALMLREAAKAGKELTAPDAKDAEPAPAKEEAPSKLTGDDAPRSGKDELLKKIASAVKVPGSGEMVLPELDVSDAGPAGAEQEAGPGEMKLPEMDLSEAESKAAALPPTEKWARMQHDIQANRTASPPPSPIAEKMKAVGWEPKQAPTAASPVGWQDLKAKLDSAPAPAAAPAPPPPAAPSAAPGPDWEGLQRQIQAAQRGADTQRTIAAMLHAAAPGFQIPSNIGEGEVAAAKLPLEIEQHRQQYEAAQRAQNEKLLADAKARELNDPNSEVSKRAQERFATTFGSDPRLVPAGLSKMSAAEIEKMTGTATTLTGQKNTADVAAAHMKAAHDERVAAEAAKQAAKDKDSVKEEEAVKALRAATASDPNFPQLHIDPKTLDGMDRKGLDEVRKRLDDFNKKREAAGGGHGGPAKPIKTLEDISDAGDRGKVKQLLDGYLNLNDLPAKSNERSKLLAYALQIDPGFDPSRGIIGREVREKIAKDPAVQAYNTALEHMTRARANIPKNFDTQMLNRLRQAVLTGSGSPEMTKFELDVKAASDEYANALGEKAQAGRQELEHMFSSVQSPEQLAARLDEVDHLMAGKLHAIQRQYQAYAPKGSELPEVLRGRQEAAPKDHGPVVDETPSFIKYKDGFIERKKK